MDSDLHNPSDEDSASCSGLDLLLRAQRRGGLIPGKRAPGSFLLCTLWLVLAVSLCGQAPAEKLKEAAARKLWKAAEDAHLKKKPDEVFAALRILRKDHSDSNLVLGLQKEIREMWTSVAPQVLGAAAAFLCDVELARDGTLTLTYDFKKQPGSVSDFEDTPTIPDIRTTNCAAGSVTGTGGWCHRATFTGDVACTIEGTPQGANDYGLVMTDVDASPVRFLTAMANNSFFGVKYDESRRVTRGHVVLFCGEGAESLAKRNPSQILGKWTTPDVKRMEPLTMGMQVRGSKIDFTLGKEKLSASTTGAAQTIQRFRVGLALHRSTFLPERVIIVGKLDPKWSADELQRLKEFEK
jgi:hypothetical protein